MTSKELRKEIDKRIIDIGKIQTEVSALAAKLIIVTKEEMVRDRH